MTPQSSAPGQHSRRRLRFVAAAAGLSTAFAVLFASCSSITSAVSTPPAPAPAQETSAATTVPTSGSASNGSGGTSTGDASSAIQAVITKANQEQANALARNDAAIMKDTATAQYYATLVQTQKDLQSQGVASIKLVDVQWGQITVSSSTGEAQTTETWQSTFRDGSSQEDTERNAYALVQQDGAWLISNDAQVGSSGGSPSTRPADAAGVSESSNWSGYSATGGPFTAVSGTWTVPLVKADSGPGSADATWVGVGGVSSDDLIQAGTEATVNSAGQVGYSAWVELLPQPSQDVRLTVRPGDVVSVSISQQATGTWRISIVDQTTKQSYQTTVQYQSSLSSVEWIEEAPSIVSGRAHVLTLDDFGAVSFQAASATLNGQQVTLAAAKSKPINMYDRSGTIATTSAAGSDGASFTVTRVASRA